MKLQNFKNKNRNIVKKFIDFRKNTNISEINKLNFSWSNWGFGLEPFEVSVKRLNKYGIRFIELHGNKYGEDLGYKSKEVNNILKSYNISVSGICGMVFPESESSSSSGFVRQQYIDYIKRHIEFCKEVGGTYILFTPGAVGRPQKYDDSEFYRAAETIRLLADDFHKYDIRCALEPVRKDEVSLCHNFSEVNALINEINHPGVKHICGDLYHMLHEESHIGETILKYGKMMTNLHLADTNRLALGTGMLDLDIVIMSLYLTGYNNNKCFCSAEPLGGGANPYDMLHGRQDPAVLDELVAKTTSYFHEREEEILNADDNELLAY